jgi:hypothetical protein
MAAEDLRIIGIRVGSRDEADAVVEKLDQQADSGQATFREVAVVYKTSGGKVRVDYVHSHAVLIGTCIGLGWAVIGVPAVVLTGWAVLPLVMGV